MSDLLQVQDLVVRYGKGHGALTAVDGASFSVPKGSTFGVVGESGCGKSTIARALVGLAPIASGRVEFDGGDVSSDDVRKSRRYRRRVQMVFQDPHSTLNPRMTVARALSDALDLRDPKLSSRARRAEIERLLDVVGLPANATGRYPHQFSGGQKQRIAIARALATGAELIVHDEVTSALDVSVQATILNLLKDLQREFGLTYVFITHDLSVVRVMSDVIGVMYLGRFVEVGASLRVFDEPAHPYTGALFRSIPSFAGERSRAPLEGEVPDPRQPPPGCRFHPRCPIGPLTHPARAVCREVDPATVSDSRRHRASCHFADAVGEVTPLELPVVEATVEPGR